MTVTARFMCPELVGNLKSGPYEVPEGSSPAQVLAQVRRQAGLEAAQLTESMLFLRNGRPAMADTVLQDGDQVFFLRKLYGG